MGWNGSGQKGAAPVQPKVTTKKPSPIRGLIAGGAVVVLAVAAYFAFFSGSEKPQPEKADKGRGRIKAVTPAAAPKAKPEKKLTNAEAIRRRWPWVKVPADWSKPYPPEAYWPDGRLKEHTRYVKVVTNNFNDIYLSFEDKVFPEGGANVEIATLLTLEPGEMLLGDHTYGDSFVKGFLRSLKTPIEISPDDSEEAKALKEAVIETRKDLKRRYDAGEDIAQIMNDTRREFQELALYREEIEAQVSTLRRENRGKFDSREIRELYGAANKMLEERGAKPLTMPEMMLRKMELREARKAASGDEGK